MYICTQCRQTFIFQPGVTCPKCNNIFFNFSLTEKKSRFRTASELIHRTLKLQTLDGFEFLGELPQKWQLLISGPPGQGKSTFCLRLCKNLARFGRVLYWSFEEKFSDTLVMKLKLNGVNGQDIIFTDVENFDDFLKSCEAIKPSSIVIDSLNDAAVETIQIKRVKSMGVSIGIYIAHFTKDERTYKGDASLKHEVDIYAEIRNFEVILKKNRVGRVSELNRPISIFEEKPDENADRASITNRNIQFS